MSLKPLTCSTQPGHDQDSTVSYGTDKRRKIRIVRKSAPSERVSKRLARRAVRDLPALLSVEQVAERLGVIPQTVHRFVREGKLECVQITARKRRFTVDQVRKYIESQSIKIPIEEKRPGGTPSPPVKGGEKSSEVSRAGLREEMRSWQ